MKKYFIIGLAILLLSGCVTIKEKPTDYMDMAAKTGLNIDSDSNDCADCTYGGSNTDTCMGTGNNVLSASPTFTGTISAAQFDGTVATTTAGGTKAIDTDITHATNALTGELTGVKGNARVNAIDSAAGSTNGGYFTSGNTTVGTEDRKSVV